LAVQLSSGSASVPSFTDIYGLTKHRNRATIDRFLDRYIDRAAEEQRDGQELLVESLDKEPGIRELFDEVEWVPVQTLTEGISLGLAHPPRCFAIYLHHMRQPGIDRVILGFTRDALVVLGICIQHPEESESREPSPEERAAWEEQVRAILLGLMQEFECHLGIAGYEFPPPAEEAECYTEAESGSAFLLIPNPP
jgi:hypothetical protein